MKRQIKSYVKFGKRKVGDNYPVYVVAEIGINHNGDLDIAKQLIDIAKLSGCDAVKFQKRTPRLCVPPEERDKMRQTPWGYISYMDYRRKIEFGKKEYKAINKYCRDKKIDWFASCWDTESVNFMEDFKPVAYKIASPILTNDKLLKYINSKKRPMILSTGMSTMKQIAHAVSLLDKKRLIITHCTSSYPSSPSELNLEMIKCLRDKFGCPVGYSGHEVGLQTTVAAAALGTCLIEREDCNYKCDN